MLVSPLGLAGSSTTDSVPRTVRRPAPPEARDVITRAVEQLQGKAGAGSVMAVVGLVLALCDAGRRRASGSGTAR